MFVKYEVCVFVTSTKRENIRWRSANTISGLRLRVSLVMNDMEDSPVLSSR